MCVTSCISQPKNNGVPLAKWLLMLAILFMATSAIYVYIETHIAIIINDSFKLFENLDYIQVWPASQICITIFINLDTLLVLNFYFIHVGEPFCCLED
jgi:hypothetical protein